MYLAVRVRLPSLVRSMATIWVALSSQNSWPRVFSCHAMPWRLTSSMAAEDVKDTLDDALAVAGIEQATVRHRPRLLSDNGPCYISKELAEYLHEKDMLHTRGRPYHPQTQGKIERYHRTMKNVVKLRNYYLPEELERELTTFVEYYNTKRVHESLDNVTPEDVYLGRHHEILNERQRLKSQTLRRRRWYNQGRKVRDEEIIRPGVFRE